MLPAIRSSLAGILAALFGGGLPASAAPQPPNIVLILADDLGFGDVQCYNPEHGKLPTPNLDRLAEQGLRFTDCHSPSSVCSPTRYGLLTGRYAWRTRLQRGVLRPYDPPLIEKGRLTLAALLKESGYATACIGKWHLGWNWPRVADQVVFDRPIGDGPTTRGFDYYFGTDVPNYPPYCFIENDRTVGRPTTFKSQRDLDGPPGPELPGWSRENILPSLIEKSVAYIDRQAGRKDPFFLYLPLTSPHEPIAPTEAFRGKSGVSLVGDFIMETDWAVGQVIGALDRHNLRARTLVIFTSDNGHTTYAEQKAAAGLIRDGHINGHRPSGPWRGFKSDIWEGGHRMPMIVSWPGRVPTAAVCNELVCLTDWMATIAELLGAPLPESAAEDSISFLQVLFDEGAGRRESIIAHSVNGRFAIRRGHYKLEFCPGSGGFGGRPKDAAATQQGLAPIQLYDLAADPGETRNLQADRPELVRELTDLLLQQIEDGRTTPGPRRQNDVPVMWARPTSRPRSAG